MHIVYRYKELVSLFFITVLVMVCLGLIYPQWGLYFLYEDPGFIWKGRITTWGDIVVLFTEQSPEPLSMPFMPSNFPLEEQSFFSVMYRPLTFVFCGLQEIFFETNAYFYLLFSTVIHAINTALIFYFFLYFVEFKLALLGSSFFAFYAGLAPWHGSIACQQYQINLLLFLLIAILLKYYIDTKSIIAYGTAILLLIMSVFLRETLIIFPAWFVGAAYLYKNYKKRAQFSWKAIVQIIKETMLLWIAPFMYVMTRWLLCPRIHSVGADYPPKTILYFDRSFFSFFSELWGLYYFFEQYPFFGLVIICSLYGGVCWLFVHNPYKKFLFFLIVSTLLFAWPSPFIGTSSRHTYGSLPFFILLLLCGIAYYKPPCKKFVKTTIMTGFALFIFAQLCFNIAYLKARERYSHIVDKAFNQFIKTHDLYGTSLCLIGVPFDFVRSVPQLVWLYLGNNTVPVYIEPCMSVQAQKKLNKNYIDIIGISNGIQLSTDDPSKVWFYGICSETMGICNVEQNNDGKVVMVNHIFSSHYRNRKMVFVTWDFENQKLKLVGTWEHDQFSSYAN